MNRTFERIFCINLARSTERWRWMADQCACFGLQVERIDAVDGRQLRFEDMVAQGLVLPEYFHARTPGALGLIATTAALWARIAASPPGWYLILEDDCRLHPALIRADVWEATWQSVPGDAQFVYVGCLSPWLNGPADDEATLLNYATPVNARCVRVDQTLQGTHAYAITPAVARLLLDECLPLSTPIDYVPPTLFPTYALRRVAAPWSHLTPRDFYQCTSIWAGGATVQLHGVASVRDSASIIGYRGGQAENGKDAFGDSLLADVVHLIARYLAEPTAWVALYEAGSLFERAGRHELAYPLLKACLRAAATHAPANDHEQLIRDFLCPDSLSVSAFYGSDPGRQKVGFRALRDLFTVCLRSPHGQRALKAHAARLRSNASFYGDNPLSADAARWMATDEDSVCARGGPSLAIVCDAGIPGEEWDPDVVRERGHGGSEEAVAYVAESLARLGCRVAVYANPPADTLHGFPVCNPRFVARDVLSAHMRGSAQRFDALIAWRNPWVVGDLVACAEKTLLWLHDGYAPGTFPAVPVDRLEAVMWLSRFHYETSGGESVVPLQRCLFTANGVVPAQFTRYDGVRRDRHRCVYASNYVRGLEVLVRAWPRVKERYPEATLDIYYGWQTWRQAPDGWEAMMRGLLADVAPLGVTEHGRVGQERLARELSSAAFWTYPCTYPETFCITGLKAQMAGCIPVYVNQAALAETVVDGFRCDDPRDYADLLLEALSHAYDEALLAGMRARMRDWALQHTWDRIAATWLHRLGWASPR